MFKFKIMFAGTLKNPKHFLRTWGFISLLLLNEEINFQDKFSQGPRAILSLVFIHKQII